MQYLLTIYTAPDSGEPAPGSAEFGAYIQGYHDMGQKAQEARSHTAATEAAEDPEAQHSASPSDCEISKTNGQERIDAREVAEPEEERSCKGRELGLVLEEVEVRNRPFGHLPRVVQEVADVGDDGQRGDVEAGEVKGRGCQRECCESTLCAPSFDALSVCALS